MSTYEGEHTIFGLLGQATLFLIESLYLGAENLGGIPLVSGKACFFTECLTF
jgi:hypothetical protein